MRDLVLPVGLLIAVLTAIYFIWAIAPRPADPQTVSSVDASTAVEAPKAAPKPAAKQKRSAKPGASVAPVGAVPVLDTAEPAAAASVAAAAVPPEPPAPVKAIPRAPASLTAVTVGMGSRQVRELLGAPSLTTATIIDGNLLETYIYTKGVQGDFARIQFRGDRVVSQSQQP